MTGINKGMGSNAGNGMDIFESFFGGGRRGVGGNSGKKKAKAIVKEMEITLEEAFVGDSHKFKFKRYRPCEDCDGKRGESCEKCPECKGRGVKVRMV